MNRGDSDLMALSMKSSGFIQAESVRDADICIFNTCSVRKHAEDRAIARVRQEKGSGPAGRTFVITGCMAQRIGPELVKKRIADLVLGPYQSPRIGEVLSSYTDINKSRGLMLLSQETDDFSDRIPAELAPEKEERPWHKWVTITHGCENFCSYCIVPHVRGRLISFPSERILKFIEESVRQGVTEISLLGQNVNQYGQDSGDIPFWSLLEKAASVKGLERVHFLTSHPMDFSEEITRVIAGNGIISRSIHLPMQSGSDRVLQLMNRKYTMKRYYEIIESMHRLMDSFAVTTDIIVGYPGESDAEFNETLDAVRNIRFDSAFMYAYSPREGTPAFELKEEITRQEKIDRLNELIHLQRKISLEKLESLADKTEKAIAERISKKSGSELSGITDFGHNIVFRGSVEDIGRERIVRITGVRGSTLVGEKV